MSKLQINIDSIDQKQKKSKLKRIYSQFKKQYSKTIIDLQNEQINDLEYKFNSQLSNHMFEPKLACSAHPSLRILTTESINYCQSSKVVLKSEKSLSKNILFANSNYSILQTKIPKSNSKNGKIEKKSQIKEEQAKIGNLIKKISEKKHNMENKCNLAQNSVKKSTHPTNVFFCIRIQQNTSDLFNQIQSKCFQMKREFDRVFNNERKESQPTVKIEKVYMPNTKCKKLNFNPNFKLLIQSCGHPEKITFSGVPAILIPEPTKQLPKPTPENSLCQKKPQ